MVVVVGPNYVQSPHLTTLPLTTLLSNNKVSKLINPGFVGNQPTAHAYIHDNIDQTGLISNMGEGGSITKHNTILEVVINTFLQCLCSTLS